MVRLFRTVATLIQQLLDVLLPRKERVIRVGAYRIEDIPFAPSEQMAFGTTITTLLTYRERCVEDLIRATKYDGSAHAAALLAECLAEYLREEIASMQSFSGKPVVLVPVPLHPQRESERGFNQIIRILTVLPVEFRDGTVATTAHDALVRIRTTAQQTHLAREERITNVRGAFAVGNLDAVLSAHIILIDDVMTTGATLSEAARPLRNLGIPVTLLALAHA